MAPPDATATGGDGNDDAASDPMQKAEKVATMAQQQQLAVTTQKKKPKKRKKKLKPSSSPAVAHQQQQQRRDSEGSIGHMQQQRGRPRVVWHDALHGSFLRAYNALGPDAVPKKILAMMNVKGVSRANVASHLQKHRLNLKREKQSIHDKRGSISKKGKRDKRTPAATNLRIHPCPDFPMVQPIQHCFTPPLLDATVPMVQPIQQCFTPPDLEAIIATMPQKLVEKQQGAGRDATALLQAAAAAASGYNPMQACQDVSVTGGGVLLCQAVSMTGEQGSVPEAEICVAQLQMAANAEEVQGGAAQPGAAEMAAKAEEGQAGSMDPPGSSVVHAYWEVDDTELSWDFGFFP